MDGIFTWRWNDDEYLRLHIFGPELDEQEPVISDQFSIGNFDWTLEAFPKGDDDQTAEYGVFNLYLVMEPNAYSENKVVTVMLRMNNLETGVSYTGITKFGESVKYDLGWSDEMLRLDELQ